MDMAGPYTLVVTPNVSDGELAVQFLGENGIEARAQETLAQSPITEGVACIVLVEDALIDDELEGLRHVLEEQPTWSDLPLILVMSGGDSFNALASRAFPDSGNLTLLERPLSPATLVAAVRVALRARARQLQVRDLLQEREEALRLREEFVAMLAHELRNPLAPMRNAVYVQQRLPIENDTFQRTQHILDRQITHLSRMVDDLLDVARLERGKVQLQRELLDLNALTIAARESCVSIAHARGHALRTELCSQSMPIDADPVRFEQLLTNLVANAAKFTPEAGEILVRTAGEDGFAVVSVHDQGIGIRPEMIGRIFEMFTQDVGTLARSSGGLGLGLTIASRIAQLHGGSLQASSAGPNQGATFTARFPLSSRKSAVVDPAPEMRQPGQRRRVLIVEDSTDIRESLGMLLSIWGYDVILASDGDRGLQLAVSENPDIALIDIGLPGTNGYEVARNIRARTSVSSSSIKLIAVTGYGQAADRERSLESGFDVHLLKPVDPKELEKILGN
jgi:two-component system, sensor histidine kinase